MENLEEAEPDFDNERFCCHSPTVINLCKKIFISQIDKKEVVPHPSCNMPLL